ncbi:MAG: penicillin-binding protein activator [Gammaproteobacteria bacterium]|nr:penicillin-binding protein activator [Gammaproteobacteria bacterium]
MSHYNLSQSVKDYLQKSEQSRGVEKQQYQLMAVNQLLLQDKLLDAQQLLQELDQISLDPSIDQQKIILEAKLALKKDDPKLAVKKLQKVRHVQLLDQNAKMAYYLTAAESYERSNHLGESVIARIQLSELPNSASQLSLFPSSTSATATIDKQSLIIWQKLQQVSLSQLKILLNQYKSRLIQGWLDLAILAKQNANDSKGLAENILSWKRIYLDHPANEITPDNQTLLALERPSTPKKIALLLPLQGQYAKIGQAVRDGFITAFYADKTTTNIDIKIYDTSQSDVCNLYQMALRDGANMAIGPLTKSNVSALAQCVDNQSPILALNYLADNTDIPDQFIQFGLSPNQAAQQAAQYAWQHGVSRVLTISPKNDWGDDVVNAFTGTWAQLGGTIINNYRFTEDASYREEIAKALNVDQSSSRIRALKNMLHEKFKSLLRRRQDINGIFLVANPIQARQIHPFLNFYYAGSLPIFSISGIYTGYLNSFRDRDLDGIYFNDMPWVLDIKNSAQKTLQSQIRSLSPKNFEINKRMYGVGVDAYLLAAHWDRLLTLPNFALHGVTGQLYLNQQHQIYQQLIWAQFKNGAPVLKIKHEAS